MTSAPSTQALNRALLARQRLLARVTLAASGDRAGHVIRMVEHLAGPQAQTPFPPHYGLWSRLDGFRPEDLAELITGRRVDRIALMRGTIRLVSARDCASAIKRLCGDRPSARKSLDIFHREAGA